MAYLDKEIAAQPTVLERLLSREARRVAKIAASVRAMATLRGIFVVARGSSDNAGLYGKYLFETRNRLVVSLAAPSTFTLYERPPDLSDWLVLAISQSGESDDLCHVVREAHRQGARTLAITNKTDSPLAQEAWEVLPLHAGEERSVAATKTYTAELMVLAMFSAALRGAKAPQALERVPSAIQRILDGRSLAEAAQRYRYMERLAVIGRGYNYATAFEISLKLKELAYLTAEPSSSADFRHGPIAVVQEGFPVLLVAPKGKTLEDLRALTQALTARRAELLVISDDKRILKKAQTPLPISPGIPEWLSPLVSVVPGQLFARHLAHARGCPLDRPRGLTKVTRTR